MLLSRIEQRNASGTALPALKYQYHLNGSYKGMLQTITYPGGGNITYHYATKTITKSERELAITAPSGYAEPKVWVANDYTVVAWRQLASGGVHTDAARNVKLFAYQWVGEWKGQELATISNIHVQEDSWSKDYKDFQVSVHDNHFAVLTRVNNTSSNYDLRIFEKSKEIRSTFIGSSFQINLGTSKPTLMGSNSYISVGPGFRTSVVTGIYTYVPNGNSWIQSSLNLSYNAIFNYFGSENFIYTQFDIAMPQPGLNSIRLRVLSEDKKWSEKIFSHYTGLEPLPNLVVGTNNFVITRENNTPKYIYNWDINYNNLSRVTTDINNNELFGNLNDTITYTSIVSNSLAAFNGRLSRFDGKFWYSRRLKVFNDFLVSGNGPVQIRQIDLSYGNDFVVWAIEKLGFDYLTGFIEFKPNELQWGNNITQIGTGQTSTVNAGISHYYAPGKYYFRQPNGNWLSVNPPAGLNGSPRSLTMTANSEVRFENGRGGAQGQGNVVRVLEFDNNVISAPYSASGPRYLVVSSNWFYSKGIGNNIFISRDYNGSPLEDASKIYLTKFISNNITGKQTDNVVSHIAINDGLTTRYIAYDYDLDKAVIDPTGATAQYHEVLEIPGSATAASKPYGYTKHFFGNGLTQQELGHTYNSSNLLWVGALYKKEMYNAINNLLASEYTRFENFGKDLLNDVATKVGHAFYTRPVEQIAMQDGIEQKTNYYYLPQTGQLDYSIALDFDGKGNNLRTNHKYFWQAYDPNRTLQIISPVVQTTQILQTGTTPNTLSVEATTWKPWIGATNYAPHKSYVWLKTGNADFNFTNWSGTGEPGGDWRKTQEINTIDALGIVQQSTSH